VGETQGAWYDRTTVVMSEHVVEGEMGPAEFDPALNK
jgi:hypothetical protein